jgi:hypothetical protein
MHQGRLITLATATAALAVAPSAALAKPPVGNTAVTITASPLTVTFGKATTISGRATGSGSDRASIALQHDVFPFEGKFSTFKTGTTNPSGTYAFPGVTPAVNNRYQVIVKTKPRATSKVVQVNVRPRVKLSVSDKTPKSGQRVRFRGTVLPAHNGRRVAIQKRTSSGWKTVARPVLKPATPVKGVARSKYSKRLRVKATRTYRTVFVPGDGDHVKGKSAKHRLVVH